VQDAALLSYPVEQGHPARNEDVSLSSDGLYRTATGLIWIPPIAEDLQLRICVMSHTGLGGHRGLKTTTDRIASLFHWRTLEEDVRTFCQSCLHCVATIGGDRVHRPLGEAMHADKPNELLHMDFHFMGPSYTMESYLLLLKDDLSGYLWLWPCRKADSATTVEALVTWFTTFGIVRTWVSDQGSHFKNRTVEGLQSPAQPTPFHHGLHAVGWHCGASLPRGTAGSPRTTLGVQATPRRLA
jgi:Integrase zinc binding domain/Integrase core domain